MTRPTVTEVPRDRDVIAAWHRDIFTIAPRPVQRPVTWWRRLLRALVRSA